MSMSRERNFNVNMANMESRNNNRNNKKKSGVSVGTVIALALVLLSMSESGGNPMIVILVIVAAAVCYGAFLLGKKLKSSQGASRPPVDFSAVRSGAEKLSFSKKEKQPGSDSNRATRSYDPELLRNRDMQRRMEQLDSFLKNGIISKDEYNILKERYMNQSSIIQ